MDDVFGFKITFNGKQTAFVTNKCIEMTIDGDRVI